MQNARVLALVTSAARYEKVGYRTGLWLGELTHVHDALAEAGHQMDVVSVRGGQVPLDPVSLLPPVLRMGGTEKRYADPGYMRQLDATRAASEVTADDYDAIFLAGGHGTMFDFRDPTVTRLVSDFAGQGKAVSAVCHGPVGLLDATGADGSPLLSGRSVTGFSWAEEKAAFRGDAVPFNLQDELSQRAGNYSKAPVPMAKKVVVDGPLITGQNPTSAKGVGEALVEALDAAPEHV
ncbi:type 1 glutamine amidotransferase domain-containing protein [Kytococcus sp. Marseille-QA3725]